MKTNTRFSGDCASAELVEEKEQTAGGTHTLDVVKEKLTKGKASVSGKKHDKDYKESVPDAKAGDEASSLKHGGMEAKTNDKKSQSACEEDSSGAPEKQTRKANSITVKQTKPDVEVCQKTSVGAEKSSVVAMSMSGLLGCNATSDKKPGLLQTIKDGAMAVKETESVDFPENTGVQTACEAVLKMNDAVGDGMMIVMSSVEVTHCEGSKNTMVGVNLTVSKCGTDKVMEVAAEVTVKTVKKAKSVEETVQAVMSLVNGEETTGNTTLEVTDKAGKDGMTMAEEVKMSEMMSDAAEGTQPDKGHSLLHPAMDFEETERASENFHTSSPEKKTMNSQDTSLASQSAVKMGKLSTTTVEDAEGEVSVMSAANKSCGLPQARVAKVLGPGDCCKVTSEDTVTSMGGKSTSEDSGTKSENAMSDTSGSVVKAMADKDNIMTAKGKGKLVDTLVCAVSTKCQTEEMILDHDCEKSQECSVKSVGGAVTTKAGVVMEVVTKEKKDCADDVSYVICVVAEEGTAFGGGAVHSCRQKVAGDSESMGDEKAGVVTTVCVTEVLSCKSANNVGQEVVSATVMAKGKKGLEGHNACMGEHGDSTKRGAADLVKAVCMVSQNVVLTVGSSSMIDRTAIDTFEKKDRGRGGYGVGQFGTDGTTQGC